MPFRFPNFLTLIPSSILNTFARCTRMQRRVNRLHTGMNTKVVKPPRN